MKELELEDKINVENIIKTINKFYNVELDQNDPLVVDAVLNQLIFEQRTKSVIRKFRSLLVVFLILPFLLGIFGTSLFFLNQERKDVISNKTLLSKYMELSEFVETQDKNKIVFSFPKDQIFVQDDRKHISIKISK